MSDRVVNEFGCKVKIQVQVFGGVLDETVQSVHACGKDIEIFKISHTLIV